MRKQQVTNAFTAIELLVTIAIIGILSAIALPVISKAKASAKRQTCVSNQKQIYSAIAIYASNYNDIFPAAKDCTDALGGKWAWPKRMEAQIKQLPMLNDALSPYIRSTSSFECPADDGTHFIESMFPGPLETTPSTFRACGISYEYHTQLGLGHVAFTSIQNPSSVNLLSDLSGHWHSSMRMLKPGDNGDDFNDLSEGYKLNMAFVDGHVKYLSYDEALHAWLQN